MCMECGCGEKPVTISAPVRVAPGQDKSIINGFDVPPPYGKGK